MVHSRSVFLIHAGSHYFTETNTIRRYCMGLPVLPDAVRLCWGCQQDMLTMRRHIGHICKRRTGEDTILTDSVQLPAPCVSQPCSPIVLEKHEKSKKRKRESAGSQMSAPQTEVPVHKVAKTLFHVDVNTKASQTDGMHARCTVPDTIRMLLGQLQVIHDVAANQVSEVYKLLYKKTGGKLAMHYHVTRRLSKQVLTFKRTLRARYRVLPRDGSVRTTKL